MQLSHKEHIHKMTRYSKPFNNIFYSRQTSSTFQHKFSTYTVNISIITDNNNISQFCLPTTFIFVKESDDYNGSCKQTVTICTKQS